VPPVGGDKDTTPPELLSIVPSDSSLNLKPNRIVATFDKYMQVGDLATNMSVSPMLPMNPTVMANGKKIYIKLIDSLLQPNTTYKISFGDAITDNRELTPFANFSYIFSTGSFFDSLMYAGRVINAKTGYPDSGLMVGLYNIDISDSAILTQKPTYVTKTDGMGYFKLDLLPNKPFKLFVIEDEDNNYLYNYAKERVGFLTNPILPSATSSNSDIVLSFLEEKQNDTLKQVAEAETTTGIKSKKSFRNNKEGLPYAVKVDTTNLKSRSFDVTKGLELDFLSGELPKIDFEKVYLSYDDADIEVEASYKVDTVEAKILLQAIWKENVVYTLRLVKGWARDSAGAELPPGRYKFRTKSKEDYASLVINIPDSFTNASYLLNVFVGEDSVYLDKITTNKVSLKYLTPGTYKLSIIEDTNGDGKWTTGGVFQKILPEMVYPHDVPVVLRSGWDNEVDYKRWILPTISGELKSSTENVPIGIGE